MKPISLLSLLIILIFSPARCTPVSHLQATQKVQIPSPANYPATETVAPTSTQTPAVTETTSPTATQTPLATLAPDSVQATMQPLFREPLDCAAPCFWDITPQQTTLDEAVQFFNHLGLKSYNGIDQEKGEEYFFNTTRYESSSGLSSNISLYGYKNLVETIRIQMSVPTQSQASRKVWSAYSPETLIKRYGSPSQVDFVLVFGPGTSLLYEMRLYFDANSMIVEYMGHDLAPSFPYSPRICPLTAPIENVSIWLGDHPRYPPDRGIELEKATSLTVDQFTQLMLGDPEQACFPLKGDVFQ